MKVLIAAGLVLLVSLAYPPQAQAIIILPALILIPIAKIVAVVIGAASLPSLTFGAVWSKLFKKSPVQTLMIVVTFLGMLAIILFVGLKIFLPNHPLF